MSTKKNGKIFKYKLEFNYTVVYGPKTGYIFTLHRKISIDNVLFMHVLIARF